MGGMSQPEGSSVCRNEKPNVPQSTQRCQNVYQENSMIHATKILLLLLVSIIPYSFAFSSETPTTFLKWKRESHLGMPQHDIDFSSFHPRSTGRLQMVRNIDLVEALIFYGDETIVSRDDDSNMDLLDGVQSLLKECQRDDTAVIAIMEENVRTFLSKEYPSIHVFPNTHPPPNPKDLWEAIHSIPPIQPKGFGGSSGFGTKAADPERSPLSKHCVVLCSTEHQCRAARYAGMRVVCMTDNSLADAVIDTDWSSLCMDDIATPGSFWLNPPHPRDDMSNAVDVETVIQAYKKLEGVDESKSSTEEVSTSPTSIFQQELSDTALAKMLADIDPL